MENFLVIDDVIIYMYIDEVLVFVIVLFLLII